MAVIPRPGEQILILDHGETRDKGFVQSWWQQRSLKFRLALWFTAVACGILLGLTPVVYALIEHRLHVEFDRQIRIDWNLIEAHLESDAEGNIKWRPESPATPASRAYGSTWFDVWSDGKQLLKHWPLPESEITRRPPQRRDQGESLYTLRLGNGLAVRAKEEPVQIGDQRVTLRVFRDESGLHATLREILAGFGLAVPIAGLLAALGGYLVARRALAPIEDMVEQARQISSESLGRRLPYPNPHDELGQLAAVFNQTLQRLQDSFEALKRFTADASHELRTPLTALRAVGEVGLRETADAPLLRDTIGSMLEEAQRLNDLTDSLLLLARVESGRSPLNLETVCLDDLALEVRESVGVLAAEKRQVIEFAADAGAVTEADRLLTRQAIMNILHNAIRYAPHGTTIWMRCLRRDGGAGIEIADEGPGIAPEYQQKIFERFFRIDKARSRAEGGAGLGLAIAKLSIEQQGGTVELDSVVGKGSRFRILLPAPRR